MPERANPDGGYNFRAMEELENIAAIQAVYYRLLGFAKEIQDCYPNITGNKGWNIEYLDYEQTFCLRLGESTIVWANVEKDTYIIDVIYNHLKGDRIRIVSNLYRTNAIAFLRESLNSISFDPSGGIAKCHNPDEITADLIETLLSRQYEKIGCI